MNLKSPKLPQGEQFITIKIYFGWQSSSQSHPVSPPIRIPIFIKHFLTFNLDSTMCNLILDANYVIDGACSKHYAVWKRVTT